MFRTILLPLDGSALAEAAIPWAAEIGEASHATMRLLRVVPLRQRPGAAPLDIIDRRLGQAEAEAYLDALASELARLGLDVELEVTEGQPADRILETMGVNQPDLVVLTTHGTGGMSDFGVSGTASKVISRAGTSILLVPTRGGAPQARIGGERRLVAALDGSKRCEWAVAAGVELARATDAELVLVHVVPVTEAVGGRPASEEYRSLTTRLAELNRQAGADYLRDVVARLEGQDVRIRTRIEVSSRVAETLVDITEAEQADMMIMAAHGSSTSPNWLYGAIAMQVLAESQRPLLIVQDAPRRSGPRIGRERMRQGRTLHHG